MPKLGSDRDYDDDLATRGRKVADRNLIKRQEAERVRLAIAKRNAAREVAVGTKKWDKMVMEDFKNIILQADDTVQVVRKVIKTALDDEHPQQGVCMKLIMERAAPVSLFGDKKDGARTQIQITISGIGSTQEVEGETIDG